MDKEVKLQKLTEILNEYVQHLKLFKEVKVELFNKTKLETNKQYTYKDCHGYEQIGNILGCEKIPSTEFVKVTYIESRIPEFDGIFQSIEFPVSDLQKRIEHYRGKVDRIKEKIVA